MKRGSSTGLIVTVALLSVAILVLVTVVVILILKLRLANNTTTQEARVNTAVEQAVNTEVEDASYYNTEAEQAMPHADSEYEEVDMSDIDTRRKVYDGLK